MLIFDEEKKILPASQKLILGYIYFLEKRLVCHFKDILFFDLVTKLDQIVCSCINWQKS